MPLSRTYDQMMKSLLDIDLKVFISRKLASRIGVRELLCVSACYAVRERSPPHDPHWARDFEVCLMYL
jgi:hypothetical protein